MLKEFKKFILRGNVIDLAVGVIIGAAFGKIVTSLVNDIITPLISLLLGKINFRDLFIALNGETYATLDQAAAAGAATINYGVFITIIIDFVLTAFVIFIVIKAINKLKDVTAKPVEEPVADTKECPYCLTEIKLTATRCPHCTSQLEVKAGKA